MKYLITGGAGFIGSHLAEALLARGESVTVIDDLSTGAAGNICHLQNQPGFGCVFASIFDRHLMAEVVDDADVVIHLAAAVGVKLIVQSPVRTIETNVSGTELVLQLASKKGKKVVIASTSEVYGKASKVPFCEDDDMVLGPTARSRWSYACSKALDEFLGLAYYHERHTPVVIVRLFNTVGPRQSGRYGMVLPRFVQQALGGEPITVYGDGSQRRCFSYVGDVVRGIIELSHTEEALGQVFNLGSDQEVSINELALLVRQLAGSDSPIRHIPYGEVYGEGFEDMPRRVPNLAKAERLIDYRPSKTLREIVQAVIDYFARSEVRPPAERAGGLSRSLA